jgi:hypothetical protein
MVAVWNMDRDRERKRGRNRKGGRKEGTKK